MIEKCTQATRDKLRILDMDPEYEVRKKRINLYSIFFVASEPRYYPSDVESRTTKVSV